MAVQACRGTSLFPAFLQPLLRRRRFWSLPLPCSTSTQLLVLFIQKTPSPRPLPFAFRYRDFRICETTQLNNLISELISRLFEAVPGGPGESHAGQRKRGLRELLETLRVVRLSSSKSLCFLFLYPAFPQGPPEKHQTI